MMAFGSSGATPKNRMAHVSVGLGLLLNVVVDQHFEQRTRLGRLLAVVAQSPSLIGLGLDEDTAAVIDANDVLEVIGRGAVTIVDGSDVITDAFQTTGHKPIMVSNARLHRYPPATDSTCEPAACCHTTTLGMSTSPSWRRAAWLSWCASRRPRAPTIGPWSGAAGAKRSERRQSE
jgi:hypothetical protein